MVTRHRLKKIKVNRVEIGKMNNEYIGLTLHSGKKKYWVGSHIISSMFEKTKKNKDSGYYLPTHVPKKAMKYL